MKTFLQIAWRAFSLLCIFAMYRVALSPAITGAALVALVIPAVSAVAFMALAEQLRDIDDQRVWHCRGLRMCEAK